MMNKGKENKPHIGIFGRTNAGKSSFINALTCSDISIVSSMPGTTTDPVKKSVELTGIGAVILIDTAGTDDQSELGKLRVKKSLDTIKTIDLAIILISENIWDRNEDFLIRLFEEEGVPFILIFNKSDLLLPDEKILHRAGNIPNITFSSIQKENIWPVIDLIKNNLPENAFHLQTLVGDLVGYGSIVLLIVPIDIEAPQGRLILPQVQAIRDILDNDAIAIVLKERETDIFLQRSGLKPDLVITDSSIFLKADAMIPKDIPLTGFSVLLAKVKGDFDTYLQGTPIIDKLKNGDKILLLESCTHHTSCDDIGRVKIPRWISNYTGKSLQFEVVSGLNNVPGKITDYALVIQCGGCMITRRQLQGRLRPAKEAGVPVTNYGMAIAWMQGIYKRAVAPFIKDELNDDIYL